MWYAKLKSELEKIGFKASEADAGLFILEHCSNKVYLLVYVDDMLIASKELTGVVHVKTTIGSIFNVRDLGEAKFFLGMKGDLKRSPVGHDQALAEQANI